MASLNVGKLYKRGAIWYFRITDENGKRVQKSTGKTLKREAQEYAQEYLKKIEQGDPHHQQKSTLRVELTRYLEPSTNPRYRQAQLHGTHYTLGHAKQVARLIGLVIKVLEKRLPRLLAVPVDQITRRDIKDIQIACVEERGHTRTAQSMFSNLKTVFSQLMDDDLIPISPTAGIPEIGYVKKIPIAIEPELIAWMLSKPEIFPSPQFYNYITVLATTGMRRSEALAIDTDHIHEGTLLIDQQVSPHYDHAVKPKWGIIRAIPLPSLARRALAAQSPDKQGRLFSLSNNDVATDMAKLKAALKAVDQKNKEIWARLTPHVLRHSANTNLLISGANHILVAEYLAWKHQDLIEMQRRYTHIVAMNLKPIADMLDELYQPRKESKVLQMKFS